MSGVNDCGTLCCSRKHEFFEVNGFLKLDNKELAELQQCLIRERWQCCRFCKKCVECKRFTFFNEQIKNANMNRDRNIYTTMYKVILYNIKYPKWRPHTVDILTTKYILNKKIVKDVMLDYF